MNARRFTGAVLVLACLVLLLAGCAAASPTVAPSQTSAPAKPAAQQATPEGPAVPPAAQQAAQKPVTIYMVSHGACAWDSYWCVVERGAKDAAKALGVQVVTLTTDKFDLEATAQNIDRALAAKPDGLAVTVTDAVLFDEPIRRAIKAGIPVVAYDSADVRPKEQRIPYLTFVGPDEYQGGYQSGDRLVKAHPGAKRGVCINHQVGSVLLDLRCTGFKERLAKDNIPVDVLSISDDAAQSTSIISDYYASHPDTTLFLTLGPNGADAFYGFVNAAGLKPGTVFHGTFDLGPTISKQIKAGVTDFAVDGQPYEVGYLPVQALTWIKRFAMYPVSDILPTGPGFVDTTNIDTVGELAGVYR